ncbi:MAG TPA: ATP-grasp domain-containing protein [Pyrinomonadaceae bacterium]
MRVLVLDGNENQSLAAVRSLAAAGHDVYVGADSSWSKAGCSRYSKGSFTYTPPQVAVDEFVDRIVSEVKGHDGTLVLPMTERTTMPLSERRDEILAAGGLMVLPPHEVVLQAFDKRRTTDLAKSLGVQVPATTVISNHLEAEEFVQTASFPVVLKPRSSEEVLADGRVMSAGAPRYAKDRAEFMAACDEMFKRSSALLVQEFIEGRGVGYFALMQYGELRAEFAHRRIRDVRPTGSGSALRESVSPDSRVRDASLKILHALSWHGVAMVEFRQRDDGTPVFLEVNGRFWNSLALAIHAGVDFPALVAEIAQGKEVELVDQYRQNVRCRWFLGDFRHLLEVVRGAPAGYPGKFPSRLRTLIQFFTPVKGTYHDNFSLRDPLPEFADWIDFVFRKLPAGLRRNAKKMKVADAESRYSLS